MNQLTGSILAPGHSTQPDDPLQYQNWLRFPPALEAAFRHDFAERAIVMQRHFIAIGFVIFSVFGILDLHAMPRTYHVAWALRAAVAPLTLLLFWSSYKPWFRHNAHWLINLWMLTMNIAILVMISVAQISEPAFTFYPIGLMLVLVCGYVAGGHVWYGSAQGWLAIIGYLLVGILDQRMLVGDMAAGKFFTINFFLIGMNIVGMVLGYTLERTNRLAFLQRLVIEQQRRESERLLLNVLPASVAERLKRGEAVADYFDQAGILFADLHGFTPYCTGKLPAEVVHLLNRVFSAFDTLAERRGLEKIKTIGDAYMVVSGLPVPRPGHLEALADMALDMQELMRRFAARGECDLQLRIGIAAGPVVAGIIGLRKFSYDLWGDTVNVASRMESAGIPGEIQVTGEVCRLVKERYLFEERGRMAIKGKGEMLVYLLKGRIEPAADPLPGIEAIRAA